MLSFTQPEMVWVEDEDGAPYVKGAFIVKTDVGYPNRIPTEIRFPPDYPRSEPWAVQTPGIFPHVDFRHFYASGRCCLWLPVQSPWRARDQYGFRYVLDQLTFFYHRQLVMDANPGSPFPGPQWDHGSDGYLVYLAQEWKLPAATIRRMLGGVPSRQSCPCGSGKRFVQCHEQRANRFRRLAGSGMTDAVIRHLGGIESTARSASAAIGRGVPRRFVRREK
jgi:hypothetical protein